MMNLLGTVQTYDRPTFVAALCMVALLAMLFGVWIGTGLGRHQRNAELAEERRIEDARRRGLRQVARPTESDAWSRTR